MSARHAAPSRGHRHRLVAWAIAAGLLVAGSLVACDDDDDLTAPADAPPGHTVVEDGVAHRPGLDDPAANCTACHGADLRGGANGEPSCFTCHGQLWP